MKKTLALVLVLSVMLMAGGCSYSTRDVYEQAQFCLGSGDYESAALLFAQLGEYRDAAEYTLYARALQAWQEGDQSLARNTLEDIAPFKNSSRYLRYMDALDYARDGSLEQALHLFNSLGAFADSAAQASEVRSLMVTSSLDQARSLMAAADFEAAASLLKNYAGMQEADDLLARCNSAMAQQAYHAAEALFQQEQYAEAYDAFSALGDTLDAAYRAQKCLEARFLAYDEDYAAITLNNCEEAMTVYRSMSNLDAAQQRLYELETRFNTRLSLIAHANEHPLVAYGRYAYGDSGADAPVLWQVLRVEDNTAVLLCCSVVDAMPYASATDLQLTTSDAETPAMLRLSLPSAIDLSGIDASLLQATATPYAAAQGAEVNAAMRTWWWLEDTLPDGHQALVWSSGVIEPGGINADEPTGGVRPLLTIDLETLPLTAGDGTPDAPYRVE